MHAQITFPEGAIGGTSGHGTQKEGIDFNDFFDGAGGNVGTHGGAGIHTDDDPAVEFKGEGGGTLGEFDGLAGIGIAAGGGEVVSAKVCGLN